MTPEDREEIIDVIRHTVNGKIDKLDAKLQVHMDKHDEQWDQVRPVVEGFQGAKVVGNSFKWLGGIALTAAALFALFNKQ